MTRATFRIAGMHCPSCATGIDLDLETLPGVKEAKTSFARSTTEVVFDPAAVDLATIIACITAAGYEAQPIGSPSSPDPTSRTWLTKLPRLIRR